MSAQNVDLTEHKALKRRAADGGPTAESGPTVHPLLRLQSQVGNSQVARLIAQRAEEDELAASHDLTQRAQEEDELALSRDDEQVGIEGGAVGPDTESQIQSMRGSGSALDDTTRGTMENSFGTSFEDVRVHHNSSSDSLNRRLTSHAFTTGSDIFLRGDASPSDNHLIAHELTHVVQQREMSGGSGTMSVGAAGDAHEQHAESVASSVLAQPATPVAATPGAQRAAEEDELAASHDMAQRAAEEEDELAASHDMAQRAAEEEDELAASHDMAQRAGEEDEMAP